MTCRVNESFWPSYKVVNLKKLDIESDVSFLIWCILDHVQGHLVAKNDDFDRKLWTFLLRYNLFIVLLHTRGLLCKGIFILPFGPILNTIVRTFRIYQENLRQQLGPKNQVKDKQNYIVWITKCLLSIFPEQLVPNYYRVLII